MAFSLFFFDFKNSARCRPCWVVLEVLFKVFLCEPAENNKKFGYSFFCACACGYDCYLFGVVADSVKAFCFKRVLVECANKFVEFCFKLLECSWLLCIDARDEWLFFCLPAVNHVDFVCHNDKWCFA